MATEVVKVIGPTGDYADWAAFQTGEARDLVALDEIAVAEIEAGQGDFWPGSIALDEAAAWVTDATRYVEVRPQSGGEHDGTPDSASTRIKPTGDPSRMFSFNSLSLIITGLDIFTRDDSAVKDIPLATWFGSHETAYMDSCVIQQQDPQSGIQSSSNDDGPYLYNCVIDGIFGGGGSCIQGHSGAGAQVGRVYNCTIRGRWDNGISPNNTDLDVRNTVVQNTLSTAFVAAGSDGSYAATSTNNASGDASASDLGIGTVTGVTDAAFADVANDDYTPVSGGVLEDAGADLSSAPFPITDDAVGVSRPQGGGYDIGGLELQASGDVATGSPAGLIHEL